MNKAIEDVTRERARQIEKEGWTYQHDDEHVDGSLAAAAACYCLPVETWKSRGGHMVPSLWPESWHVRFYKPRTRRENLVRAAALLIAEIERIDRKQGE